MAILVKLFSFQAIVCIIWCMQNFHMQHEREKMNVQLIFRQNWTKKNSYCEIKFIRKPVWTMMEWIAHTKIPKKNIEKLAIQSSWFIYASNVINEAICYDYFASNLSQTLKCLENGNSLWHFRCISILFVCDFRKGSPYFSQINPYFNIVGSLFCYEAFIFNYE